MGQPDIHPVPGLRRAGPQDADSVRDLTRAAYAKWQAGIPRKPDQQVYMIIIFKNQNYYCQ